MHACVNSVHFNLLLKVCVCARVCVHACTCVHIKDQGYVHAILYTGEDLLPGVITVPITIGSRNSVTIHGSGKYAGFVMVISDPP